MKGSLAGLLFLLVCVVLAALLLAHVVKPLVSGMIFAIALVVFGIVSRGFRRPAGPAE
jgi:hypothetical protein